ncbi:MAG: hypothetical protein H7Z42_19280 [Roseiflexaceae bacterium]|nr:hypothetical protein [Roseiflexaceae bacterium]
MTIQPPITRAAPETQPLIERLYQLFLSELASLRGHTPGQAAPPAMPALQCYWQDVGYAPFLLVNAGQLAGFALVSPHSRIHATYNGCACEVLFVLRPHRRRGIGQFAAQALFGSYPGFWEVSAEATNTPGSTFWRATVDRYTNGRYHETWLQNTIWRGPVQSFTSPPGTANNKRLRGQFS